VKNKHTIIYFGIYCIVTTAIIINLLFVRKQKTPQPYTIPEVVPTDTIYESIDSLDLQRDTIEIYYETKTANYHILPSSERISLFASRINR